MSERIKVGVSTCLLGEPVRYDGAHKRDPIVVEALGSLFDYVPICPEFECGLGAPREPMRLEGDPAAPHLVTHDSRLDLTERMLDWCQRRARALADDELCGFICKARSPSCGAEGVGIHGADGEVAARGAGLFVRVFMALHPRVPVVEAERLHDAARRERFIEQVQTCCSDRYRSKRA